MSGMVGQLAKRFPAIKQIERSATHPTQSLDELRRDIWQKRGEYWYRKVSTYPDVVRQAQSEAVETWNSKLSKPGTWTWGDVVAGGIIGIQVVGAFALGEVIGRGSLIGYAVGDSHGH